jgi:hypothetical protein
MFGLATIRTVVPFASDETYEKFSDFVAKLIVASTMVMAYIWFIKQFVSLNGI